MLLFCAQGDQIVTIETNFVKCVIVFAIKILVLKMFRGLLLLQLMSYTTYCYTQSLTISSIYDGVVDAIISKGTKKSQEILEKHFLTRDKGTYIKYSIRKCKESMFFYNTLLRFTKLFLPSTCSLPDLITKRVSMCG